MRLLGLDTATPATAVALLDTSSGMSVARRDDPPAGARPRHTARLLALVAEAMTAAGWGWDDIDRIAVGVGPGTFTGLRIGIATAQALARTRGIDLVGVSTLQSLAASASAAADDAPGADAATGAEGATGADSATGADGVLAVIDARRREVFAAGWTPGEVADPGAAPLIAAAPRPPALLAEMLAADGRAWLAAGDGAVAFREVLERAGVRIPGDGSGAHRVDAVQHCRLAVTLAPEAPDAVRPSYLRLPDAEISRQAARQR